MATVDLATSFSELNQFPPPFEALIEAMTLENCIKFLSEQLKFSPNFYCLATNRFKFLIYLEGLPSFFMGVLGL